MKKHFLSFTFLVLILFNEDTTAQATDYLARFQIYLGGSFDRYALKDPGGKIDDTPIGTLSGGLEVDVEYSDIFAFGGGLIFKTYSGSVDFVGGQGASASPSMESLQIPVYLRARTYLLKGKAQAYLLSGGAWAFNLSYDTGNSRSRSSFTVNGDNISYAAETNNSLKKSFPLLMGGAGIDFPIYSRLFDTELRHLRFGFSARRFFGFSNVMRMDIDYEVNNTDFFTAVQTYSSGHWMFNVHFMVAM